MFFTVNENDNETTKTITSKRNSIVLWNFLVLIVADMKYLCLSVLLVYATQRIANCVALAILIGTYEFFYWLMIYVPLTGTEVMPASVFNIQKCQNKN